MAYRTVASIDLDAVVHNATVIRRLAAGSRLCGVVKANAYGHGAPAVAHALAAAGADMLGVAMVEEAVELREAGIRLPILVLSPLSSDDVETVFAHDLIASITDEAFAGELARQALARQTCARVHVKVDTGMHRLGFDWETAARSFVRLGRLAGLRVSGVFTHFACADAEDLSFSHEQTRRFLSVLGQLGRAGARASLAHAANSCGVLRLPEAHLDAVRPGLILYGLRPGPAVGSDVDLRPVMHLRTHLAHCRRVRAGEKLGYGHSFTVWRDSVIGVLPFGYADGYRRAFSNLGEMLVRGRRVPVVGRICMDQTLVDLTDVPGVQTGEEVVVYGRQGAGRISVEEMAERVDCIPYELTCAVGRRVRREFVLNGVNVVETGRRSSVSAETVERLAALADATAHERLSEQAAERGTG